MRIFAVATIAWLFLPFVPVQAASMRVSTVQQSRGTVSYLPRGRFRIVRRSPRVLRTLMRTTVRPVQRPAVRASSSSSAAHTATGSGVFDSDLDTSAQPRILLLGRTTPVLASVKFFSTSEPVSVDTISVALATAAASVDAILLYDGRTGEWIGTATARDATTFTLTLPDGRMRLPHRVDRYVYARARLKEDRSGGESGEQVRIATVQVSGTGDWSNSDYSSTSTDTFPLSQTAVAALREVRSVGSVQDVLAAGSNQLLARFRFTGETTDGRTNARVTALRFQIEQAAGVTLSNVRLESEDASVTSSCVSTASLITCDAIPAALGTADGAITLRVYGDIAVPSDAQDPFLRLTLNDPGTTAISGAVSWSDGYTTFTWLPFEQPLARGTLLR